MAAKTPKQDDDEEDYDPEQQQLEAVKTQEKRQYGAINTPDDLHSIAILAAFSRSNQHLHDDDRVKIIQIICRHLEPVLVGEAPSIMLTKFTGRHLPQHGEPGLPARGFKNNPGSVK